jgi:hypothetical protein
LRRTARVRAFTQFAAAALSRERALFEGAAPPAGIAAPELSFAGPIATRHPPGHCRAGFGRFRAEAPNGR